MSTTTQEDYFGNAVDAPARHRKHRHKHSKPRSYVSEPESEEEETISVPSEREYKKTTRRHKHRDPAYEPEVSEEEVEEVNYDDGGRRRRKHRHHKRERFPDDVSSTVPDADSATDTEDAMSATESSRSSMRRRDRAKSIGESAIATMGLGDAYKRARSKSRGRKPSLESDEGYDSNEERNRSRSGSRMHSNTAQAAIIAAAVEAFRARKEPGGVTGGKGLKRVVEAAVASGAVEKFLDRKGESDGKKSNKRIAESVLAGLATQRGLNGKRSRSRGYDDDEPANPLKDLAASGLIAAASKKFLDYQRSRSQSRGREEDPERPGMNRRRSRSVGEALAAMGLGGLAAERLGKSRRDSRDSKGRRLRIRDDTSSDSSLSDTDLSLDEEQEQERHKRLRRKEIISVAMAILATLHLGQSGYEAKEKRDRRRELLESGRITEEESQKLKRKAVMKDATAVGLAILAATEAVKAWKGLQKTRKNYHDFEDKHPRIEEHRRQKAIEAARRARTPSPGRGEASRYYSQPGYMGPPPGAPNGPAYNYYPSSGPIPNTYGTRDAYSSSSRDGYSTRDGREIPVVYPSSVTHA